MGGGSSLWLTVDYPSIPARRARLLIRARVFARAGWVALTLRAQRCAHGRERAPQVDSDRDGAVDEEEFQAVMRLSIWF